MEKRDKKMPYEVVIQERKRVDLYGNVVYYIYWFDKYGYNITNEWKFWSKGSKCNNEIERYRLATDSEKQRMIKALKKSKILKQKNI